MQVIELRGDENISVIHNLLETAASRSQEDQAASDRSVLLYVPRGCEALERDRVNLAVLRRWADNLTLLLGVVIEDRETRGLAREVGLLVLHSIEQGQRSNLGALDRRRRRHQGLPPRPITSILPMRATRPTDRRRRRAAKPRIFAGLFLAILLLAGLGLGLLFILPSATVTLQPTSEPAEASMEMVGVAGLEEINYGSGEVPARIASVEQESTDRIATTARIEVPDGYAQGAVVFANKTTIPVTITKGTVVRTSTGENVRFYTVDDALLPGQLYGTVRVGILAADAGPQGNVAAFSINVIEGELAAQAGVLNDARTSGGTVRRMGAVDGEDLVQLRAKLMKSLQEEAYRELTAALAQSEVIPADSLVITILNEEFDHKTGEMAGELGLTMKVKASGLAINTADGEELLLRLLEQRMKPGYQLVTGSATSRATLLEATAEQARFSMTVRASMAPAIDAQAVSEAIAGKSVAEAQTYLSDQFALRTEPQIKLESSLLQHLPWWSRRIRVQVITATASRHLLDETG